MQHYELASPLGARQGVTQGEPFGPKSVHIGSLAAGSLITIRSSSLVFSASAVAPERTD